MINSKGQKNGVHRCLKMPTPLKNVRNKLISGFIRQEKPMIELKSGLEQALQSFICDIRNYRDVRDC